MSISHFHPHLPAPSRIGVLLREEHLRSRMNIMDGVINYCLESSGLMAFLIPLKNGEKPSPELLSRVDGLITWAAPDDLWLRDVWESGTPVVNCNDALAGVVPSVSPGNLHDLAYDYLKSLERRTIGYVTTPEHAAGWPGGMDRFALDSTSGEYDVRVFTNVTKDPGQFPEHILWGEGEEELEKFLLDLPKPAALWCVHDEMAALVWRKASELGIDVPNEIALLGFGDHPCAVYSTPGITTVRVPSYHLGQVAAERVHRQITGSEQLTMPPVTLARMSEAVIERMSSGGSNEFNRGIQRAWRLLEDYPENGLTVDHLIEKSNISRAGFYKEFEKAFNISPGKAIRNARVRKAREYLLSSNMPISAVGRRCAFGGEAEFSNFFKRETGKTPLEWRNSHYLASSA